MLALKAVTFGLLCLAFSWVIALSPSARAWLCLTPEGAVRLLSACLLETVAVVVTVLVYPVLAWFDARDGADDRFSVQPTDVPSAQVSRRAR